jgi:hypothetical protein
MANEEREPKLSFFEEWGNAQEYLIWKSGVGRMRISNILPCDIPSQTRPVIPGGLRSRRARVRFTG